MKPGVLSIIALALAGCGAREPAATEASERAELIVERVALRDRATASGLHIDKLDCPARNVSDETAEAMLLMWVNNRQDLVDRSRLQTYSDDMISAFEKCGADMGAVLAEMRASDDTLMRGLTVAILQSGRGLN